MDEQFKIVIQAVDTTIKQSEERIMTRVSKLEMKIEHDVTKKIEVLFDNYKLTHEKQWELERRMEKLEQQMQEMQNRTA